MLLRILCVVYWQLATFVMARCRRHHQSRTTRVWNVLEGKVQGRSWVLDSGCTARGGLGFWILVAWHVEVLGSGFWLHRARRSWVLDSGCMARGGFGFLAVRRGKVMLGLAVWCEEGFGYGGAHSLYIRVRCCLSCMFLLQATTYYRQP